MKNQYETLNEILNRIFSFSWDLHPEFDDNLQKFFDRQDTRITRIMSDKFQIKANVGHTWQYPDMTYEMVHYVSDRKINRNPEKVSVLKKPLDFMPDSNYYYWGCYLSVCAYLLDRVPDRMMIYCGPEGNEFYHFKYRPEIAKIILAGRLIELGTEEPEFISQINLFS